MATIASCCFMSPPCLLSAKRKPLQAESLIFGKFASSGRPNIPSVKCSRVTSSANTEPRFHPRIWKEEDFVSSSETDSVTDALRLEELKQEVKNMLSLAAKDPFQELDLVDHIQRLGVAYHFETEIKDVLERTYKKDYGNFFNEHVHFEDSADLHHVALRFRLLRQAGYYVSPGVFDKFKDEKAEFYKEVLADVRDILSLYEASHVSFNGEDIMDDALSFTTEILKSMVSHSSSFTALLIQRALDKPIHKSTEREQARNYIRIYDCEKFPNGSLLEFAKLDYNIVQLLHQKELRGLFRWWDRINFMEKMPYNIRDRVAEAFIMTISWNFEPQFSLGRIHLTKMWCIYSILDDSYEGCGNLHDLKKLSDAFQRWDDGDVSQLPYHLKEVFQEVLIFFEDIKADMLEKGHYIGLDYLKKELQEHINALYEETKMHLSKEINPSTDLPTFEQCLSVTLRTISLNPFLVDAVMNMDKHARREIFDWALSMTKIVKCSSLLQRLFDDIADYEVEKATGILISSVTCYMNDHNVSESKAIERLRNMITRCWKDHNEEILRANNPLPMSIIKILLNVARNMILNYSNEDGYTNANGHTKEIITTLLIDKIPM